MTFDELVIEVNTKPETNHKALAEIIKVCGYAGSGNMVSTDLIINLVNLEFIKASV